MYVKTKKLTPEAILPTKNNEFDAGFDLYNLEDVEIPTGIPVKIKTGIAIEIPEGYVGLIWPRSGLGSKGIQVLGGVIDSTYRGELIVCLINNRHGDTINEIFNSVFTAKLEAGSKIAQLLIQPVLQCGLVEVDELSETSRGNKGFGSSGV